MGGLRVIEWLVGRRCGRACDQSFDEWPTVLSTHEDDGKYDRELHDAADVEEHDRGVQR